MVNKKSQLGIPDRTVKIIIYGFVLTAIVFAFIVFAYSFRTPYVPKDLDMMLLSERFTNTCFPYQDPDTMRLYPGTIDISAFTKERLDSCFYLEDDVTARAFLLKLDYGTESKTIKTKNWIDNKNFGTITRNVLVYSGGKSRMGIIRIAYQEP